MFGCHSRPQSTQAMLAFATPYPAHRAAPLAPVFQDAWGRPSDPALPAALHTARAQTRSRGMEQLTATRMTQLSAVGRGDERSTLRWGSAIKAVVLVVALASFLQPFMITVGLLGFLSGLAFARLQSPDACNGEGDEHAALDPMLSVAADGASMEIEDLKERVALLERTAAQMHSSKERLVVGTASQSSLKEDPIQVVESTGVTSETRGSSGTNNPHSGMEDPRSNARMRERILFLWGEQGLQWFGLKEDQYWPQLARSADSEAFLQRNKCYLESILSNGPADVCKNNEDGTA